MKFVVLLLLVAFVPLAYSEGSSIEEDLKLEFYLSKCESKTEFMRDAVATRIADNFDVNFSIPMGCSFVAEQPTIKFGGSGITLGVSRGRTEWSMSCLCQFNLAFKFEISDTEIDDFKNVYLTVDGAVESQADIQ